MGRTDDNYPGVIPLPERRAGENSNKKGCFSEIAHKHSANKKGPCGHTRAAP